MIRDDIEKLHSGSPGIRREGLENILLISDLNIINKMAVLFHIIHNEKAEDIRGISEKYLQALRKIHHNRTGQDIGDDELYDLSRKILYGTHLEINAIERDPDLQQVISCEDISVKVVFLKRVMEGERDITPDIVGQWLDTEDNEMVTATLISVIKVRNWAFMVDILKRYLMHIDARVVANTVEAIDRLADPKRKSLMLLPLLSHGNHRVRANACIALYGICDEDVRRSLYTMIETGNLDNLKSALYVIDKVRDFPMLQKRAERLLNEF